MIEQSLDTLASSYNDVPYLSRVFQRSQPYRIGALAKMRGLNPPPVENARVLEIGCAFGGNILPIAMRYPHSYSVGIDLSAHQIQEGQRLIEYLGLTNIELYAGDIAQVTFDIQFDYIICHGVFSWVPETTQEAILATIEQYLAPNGIAYISYNVYPGWKSKDIIKDMMRFSSDHLKHQPEQRIDAALGFLEFINARIQEQGSLNEMAAKIQTDTDYALKQSKDYIAHEYLEEFNIPMYFNQFVEKLSAHNLAYVLDSDMPNYLNAKLFTGGGSHHKAIEYFQNDINQLEQYFDFVHNRTFRCSIITHQKNFVESGISSAWNTLFFRNIEELYLQVNVEYHPFDEEKGFAYWTVVTDPMLEYHDTPLNNAIFEELQGMTQLRKVAEIIAGIEARAGEHFELDQVRYLLTLIMNSQAMVTQLPIILTEAGEKPMIPAVFRRLWQYLQHKKHITTLSDAFFNAIELKENSLGYLLFPYLDGTRTVEELRQLVRQKLNDGNLTTDVGDISDEEIQMIIINQLDILKNYGFFTKPQ